MKIILFLLCLLPTLLFAARYRTDPEHSRIGFRISHMMINHVNGQFNDYIGTFDFDPKAGTLKDTSFVVKTNSIDTGVQKRDDHLRTKDFFNVEKFPEMTITNSKITRKKKNDYKWTGDLTLLGVTKPVTFDLTYNGMKKDKDGKNKVGFTAKGKINRQDFGMTFNAPADGGGLLVGNDVDILIDIEAFEEK
ncbi:YceI family protein [Peredibacter sp. HCB2-198]|uniref:YceI family protein n=1 Tax=Peredibacter sp. HCB2-198 TaxID=3383025 RepID=UPI0038B54EB8